MIRPYIKGLMVLLLASSSAFGQVDIAAGEYFFDTDPGVGNGTPLPAFSAADTVNVTATVDLTGLSEGHHFLFVRFKDADGRWGISEGKLFEVLPQSQPLIAASEVASAEYFFDTDPGVGNGTPLPSFAPEDTVDVTATIDLNGLSEGHHYLFVRFKDAEGNWGIYEGKLFEVLPEPVVEPTVADIVAAEYFFDTDPGVGNGIALPSFSPADTVDLASGIDLTGMPAGTYNLFVRFIDADGNWGIYEGREFEILNCSLPAVAFQPTDNQICLGESVTFTDQSTDVDLNATYAWDVDNDGTTDFTTVGDLTHTFLAAGTYEVELKIANDECMDSTTQTITVNPTYDLAESFTICEGTDYTFPDGTTETNVTAQVVHVSNLSTQGSLCDSVITTTLNVSTGFETSETVNVCEGASHTFPDGTTQSNITAQVVYVSTLQATTSQCDSTVTTTVNVTVVEVGVTQNGGALEANASGATYQWLDCDNGNAPISGETNQSFTPTVSGNYAVEVTQNNCVDVSNCISVTVASVPNDECAGAIALDVNATCVTITADVDGATQSLPSCTGGDADDDVWFSFVATGTSATVEATGSAVFDAVLEVFEGTCSSWNSISCTDLTLEGETETAELTGLNAGETYYARVHDYYSGISTTSTFDICVYSLTVGMEEAALSNVLLYPNPTNGQFTIAGTNANYSIEIYNNMGQLLLRQDAVQANTTLNLQQQAAGIYHVHVITNDNVSRFKLVKE